MTSTLPVPGGEVAWISAPLITLKVATVPPNLTSVAPVKPVPMITTAVPPSGGPEFGVTERTVGGAT